MQIANGHKVLSLLVVGSDHEAALENYYLRYMAEAGIKHNIFAAQSMFYNYYNKSFFHKAMHKLGVSPVFKEINEKLLDTVEELNPDVLLVFKGMEIFPATLELIKRQGVKLVNYNPDSPFLFSGPGSGNDYVEDAVPLYDLHVTYDRDVMNTMTLLNHQAAWIPFGFDLEDEMVEQCSQQQEINRICFLGFPDEIRSEFLNELAWNGFEIDVYGGKWKRYRLHKNITVHGPVYGIDFWKVLRRYRVQLNLMRPHNPDSHNMRTFEVPAVGGIGLYPDTPDHREFFKDQEEVFLYRDMEECVSQAEKLLSMSTGEALAIRMRARQRCISSDYSYKHRAAALIDLIAQITST